jgi:glutathione S-transferase
MSDIIFHHYANSPFSEKIRLVFGFKKLAWKSVTIPAVMPKPDLVALTGGYRRTPVMQIGADIYCDTALMAEVLEGIAPSPSLYPAGMAGQARLLAQWGDSTLFWTALPFSFQPAGMAAIFDGVPPEVVKVFAEDRAAMRGNAPRMAPGEAEGQLREQLRWLEDMLADGKPFLLGQQACIADFSVYHCLWFVHRIEPLRAVFGSTPKLSAWIARMAAFGHGDKEKLGAEDAIAIAKAATPIVSSAAWVDYHGVTRGDRVTITPTDYALDAVEGELVLASANELAIRRVDERAGEVVVHFPRLAYKLKKI